MHDEGWGWMLLLLPYIYVRAICSILISVQLKHRVLPHQCVCMRSNNDQWMVVMVTMMTQCIVHFGHDLLALGCLLDGLFRFSQLSVINALDIVWLVCCLIERMMPILPWPFIGNWPPNSKQKTWTNFFLFISQLIALILTIMLP